MAKTLNELVYDIKNPANGGVQSDDVTTSDRQVAYWINDTRDMLTGQLFAKGKSVPDTLIQHLECVELECLDPAECCEISSCLRVLRSTQKLPRTIQRNDRNTILSVASPDKTTGFTETTYIRQRSNAHNRYTGSKPRWFIKNDYLYITNIKVLEYVSVSGVFEDPTEAIMFTDCDGHPCFTWDSDYPVTGSMGRMITSIVLKERMGISMSATNDENNDARDSTKQNKE
jgi:hypothetical protein